THGGSLPSAAGGAGVTETRAALDARRVAAAARLARRHRGAALRPAVRRGLERARLGLLLAALLLGAALRRFFLALALGEQREVVVDHVGRRERQVAAQRDRVAARGDAVEQRDPDLGAAAHQRPRAAQRGDRVVTPAGPAQRRDR